MVTHTQAGWQEQVAVENIGLGGVCIKLESPLAVGDVVTLSLTAPTLWDPLVLHGRVAWVAPELPASSRHGRGEPELPASSRAAGVAFVHKATDVVFALYELIVTLGYE
jgi:Tfp pilus assembly protein PilZ